MELPLHREKDERHGSYFRNCRFVDAIRRSTVNRLPHGAALLIAAMLDQFNEREKVLGRVRDEHSAQTRYSLDVFVADLIELRTEDARHILQKIARPLGLWVIPAPASALEDSAA